MLIDEFLPVADEFELDSLDASFSEEMLFNSLAERVADLMDKGRMEFLLNLLYRHDIKESLIWEALSPTYPELPHLRIAQLIINRFKQKMLTRQVYKTPPVGDWLNFD